MPDPGPAATRPAPAARRRLRVLTWHVHGNYLYYLSHVPHDLYLVTDATRSLHHTGRSGSLPWGPNVHEVRVEQVRRLDFDLVLFQSRTAWDDEQQRILSPAQQSGPRIYLEHDPPQQHPTDTVHWVTDPQVLLVHVTPFNALMWNCAAVPTRVIEHGVAPLAQTRYRGTTPRGIVVVNHLQQRGRRLGWDVYREVAAQVPLTLVGMGSDEAGGAGEVPQERLPEVMAAHRFFFNPIRYTSLGLAVVEAMLAGLPVVGLATTELVTVIRNGENGFTDTRVDRLVQVMRQLLDDAQLARAWGQAARRTAQERFDISRFVAEWDQAFRTVCG
jgi:glycosyltransferase involved in cell wall biosynthesis